MDFELDYKMDFLYDYGNDIAINHSDGIEMAILHHVYGEDIDISVDVKKIAKKFDILLTQKNISLESHMYFNKQKKKFVIEYKKTQSHKQSYVIAVNMAYLFLGLIKKRNFELKIPIILNHNHLEHRSMNNIANNIDKRAELFAGRLLIPKGALEHIFKDIKTGDRYVVSDLCKAFNVSNDLMFKMLHYYDLWDQKNIYDNLSLCG